MVHSPGKSEDARGLPRSIETACMHRVPGKSDDAKGLSRSTEAVAERWPGKSEDAKAWAWTSMLPVCGGRLPPVPGEVYEAGGAPLDATRLPSRDLTMCNFCIGPTPPMCPAAPCVGPTLCVGPGKVRAATMRCLRCPTHRRVIVARRSL